MINSDYVRTARAKGVPEWQVTMRHVFRNALIPLTTVTTLRFGDLLGGAIIVETVFTLDGFGYYFNQKLGQLDVYAVMAYLMVTAVIIIAANLIADILYGILERQSELDLKRDLVAQMAKSSTTAVRQTIPYVEQGRSTASV